MESRPSVEVPEADEQISQQKVSEIIEEFEGENPTRSLTGIWASVAGVLASLLSIVGLYWTQYSITTQVYRAGFLLLVLVLSFILYPMLKRHRDRVQWYDVVLIALSVSSLVFLLLTFRNALMRTTNPTGTEVVMGLILMVLVMEATRRTTGWALPIVTIAFLAYALLGPFVPEPFDHRGYGIERVVGKNYLTLEGIFSVPLDVASTFIVLFTIYGAVLEYSGAGKFFLDWSFAALGKSKSGSGPGRTVTAAGFLLGTVSGSGVATTVTLGSLAWPMLKRAGYNREAAGGVLSAAGIGATLSPPTLGAAAFLIAEYLEISYLEVLVMAAIPTILYYLSCLLMIEADSRRMDTHAVEVRTESLRHLTLRYGYHFTSLFAVAVLMGLGMTPFMAVFWSIAIAFALSFLREENRLTSLRALGIGVVLGYPLAIFGEWSNTVLSTLPNCLPVNACTNPGFNLSQRPSTVIFWVIMASVIVALITALRQRRMPAEQREPQRILQAVEGGGKQVVSIAATTACAGIIVSIVTLTGLGLKLSSLIVSLAAGVAATFASILPLTYDPLLSQAPGTLFFTVLLAAVAVWILGLAVPVTASYIIAAVMIVPALTEVGVPVAAAHMFIFYYAVLADVSPPTALAPTAAAAITGGKPYATMLQAWKYCLPAFLVPFMFTLSREGATLLLLMPDVARDAANQFVLASGTTVSSWTEVFSAASFKEFVLPGGDTAQTWLAAFGAGGWLTVLISTLTACIAVGALAIAFGGWFLKPANLIERLLMAGAGLFLLYADRTFDTVGLSLLLLASLMHLVRIRRQAAPVAA